MDQRKKPIPKEVLRAERIQFYEDVEAGRLSLRDAAKKMRSLSGLTQIEFAQHRGVSLKAIKEIESGAGNPTIKTLNQIAAIFALEVAYRRTPRE